MGGSSVYGYNIATFAAQSAILRCSRTTNLSGGADSGRARSIIKARGPNCADSMYLFIHPPLQVPHTAWALKCETSFLAKRGGLVPNLSRKTISYLPCLGKYFVIHSPRTCSLVRGAPPQNTHDVGRRGSGGAYFSAFAHRARAARLAISLRRFALSFSARALPPLRPPRRPSATAAGFLPSDVADATIREATAFRSLLERLGIRGVCHRNAKAASLRSPLLAFTHLKSTGIVNIERAAGRLLCQPGHSTRSIVVWIRSGSRARTCVLWVKARCPTARRSQNAHDDQRRPRKSTLAEPRANADEIDPLPARLVRGPAARGSRRSRLWRRTGRPS